MIHREALVAKKLSPELNKVVQDAVKIINFIKSRALNSRLFANLCDEMESDHNKLLLHCEVRWLSKGKALKDYCCCKVRSLFFYLKAIQTWFVIFTKRAGS